MREVIDLALIAADEFACDRLIGLNHVTSVTSLWHTSCRFITVLGKAED